MLLITLFLAGCGGGGSADPQGGSVPIKTGAWAESGDHADVEYRIPSSAMEPTLHCAPPAFGCEGAARDLIEVDTSTNIGRADIVVFKTPPLAEERCGAGGTFVKRVIGLPGDRVELRNEGGSSYVYINGKKLDEPYIEPDRRDTRENQTYNVPADEYFMMGDNRHQSCDSREWGTVPTSSVIGEVVLIKRKAAAG